MCGIVGYITIADDTIELTKDKFFTEALFVDTLRGDDSTGVMMLTEDFRWSWQKQAVPASDFVLDKGFRERTTKTWCAVGHNRAATIGKVTTDNAHPFQQGDVLLVHNGTLRGTYDLPHKNHEIDVDSELIAYNLSKEEPDKAHEILSKLNGAYALVWFDERDESVNFARNTERPLHMGTNKDENALFFASDGYLLNFVGSRLPNHNTRPTSIFQIGAGQLLKYKKGSLVPEVTSILPFVPRNYGGNRVWTPYSNHMNNGLTQRNTGGSGTGITVENYTETDRVRVGARAARDGKAMVAGELRRIPDAHVEMLTQWYSLEPGNDYLFEGEEWHAWGRGTGAIYGRMWHPEWQTWVRAYVVDGTYLSLKGRNYPWTATPIGVDHSAHWVKEDDKKANDLTIIMRLAYYDWNGDVPREEQTDEPDKALVKGPHGDITTEAYVALCQDGCSMCSGPIFISDHEETLWIGEMGNQPMCKDCSNAATIGSNDAQYIKD
jgi:predicted glutamine amidotransferase